MGQVGGRSPKDYCIVGAVFMAVTIAVMVFGQEEPVPLEIPALLGGTALGTLAFGSTRKWQWFGLAGVLLAVAVTVRLGPEAVAWFGGFLAGTNFGAGWQEAARRRRRPTTAWIVDDLGFDTVAGAREAASAALRILDGKDRGRMDVEHGSAHFQVTGNMTQGMVCHRTADASDERLWKVLVRSDQVPDEHVDVRMGNAICHVHRRKIHNLDSAQAALDDFLKDPASASPGPDWVAGVDAEISRVTAY